MEYTPGPWEFEGFEGVIFNRELGINICSVYPFNREANGNLIAAAPLMAEYIISKAKEGDEDAAKIATTAGLQII